MRGFTEGERRILEREPPLVCLSMASCTGKQNEWAKNTLHQNREESLPPSLNVFSERLLRTSVKLKQMISWLHS